MAEDSASIPVIPQEVIMRVAEKKDPPVSINIYNEAFPSHHPTANTIPWTIESRKARFLESEPNHHPIYTAEVNGQVIGRCSPSVYRPGRLALRFTAEISCYIDTVHQQTNLEVNIDGFPVDRLLVYYPANTG